MTRTKPLLHVLDFPKFRQLWAPIIHQKNLISGQSLKFRSKCPSPKEEEKATKNLAIATRAAVTQANNAMVDKNECSQVG